MQGHNKTRHYSIKSRAIVVVRLLACLSIITVVSCNDSSAELSSQFAPVSGSLERSEILERVESGTLIGISREELTRFCGESVTTDKYPEFDYKNVIGVCDSTFAAYQWLLVRFEGSRVVEAKLDCD